jgi:Holliday junction DNA helicase RuvA
MIALLRGTLIERSPSRIVVEVRGVGYELHVPVSTFSRLPEIGAETALHVHTHVREDALQLYGFATTGEKRLFEKLIAISGIGPRVALSILSGIPAEDLTTAILSGNLSRLTAIPGIGKKTAERVLMELRDKLGGEPGAAAVAAGSGSISEDLMSALLNLGYPRPLAENTVAQVLKNHPDRPFEELFKLTMQRLNR